MILAIKEYIKLHKEKLPDRHPENCVVPPELNINSDKSQQWQVGYGKLNMPDCHCHLIFQ